MSTPLTRRAMLTVLLGAMAPAVAVAQDKGDAIAVLRRLYADVPEAKRVAIEDLYSRRLRALFDAAVKKADETGEVVAGLDFDVVSASQDEDPKMRKSVKFTPVSQSESAARIRVDFRNYEPVRLIYDFVRENGAWRIDEVADAAKGSWVISKLYEMGARGE